MNDPMAPAQPTLPEPTEPNDPLSARPAWVTDGPAPVPAAASPTAPSGGSGDEGSAVVALEAPSAAALEAAGESASDSTTEPTTEPTTEADPEPGTPAAASRKRPRPGERRVQILETLAGMLEQPGGERVTTAALAARLSVSEAALYRHFASKAQMFEGLIEFIEGSLFTLVNQIVEREPVPAAQARQVLRVLLQFGERNPGMTRVMVGDALVFEHERLLARMNQFFDRIESQLRQCLRLAAEQAGSPTPTADAQAQAAAATAFAVGRLHRYARSGFKRLPTEHLDVSLALLVP